MADMLDASLMWLHVADTQLVSQEQGDGNLVYLRLLRQQHPTD
jgi:hypothetical protein